MIRATTGGVLRSYRRNLMNSFTSVNKSRDTVLSQRTFNSYAEDPAAAAKAFRLRKSRMTVDSQHRVASDTYHKYQSAFSCLQSIDEVLDTETAYPMKTLTGTTLTMLNDPTGDAREQLTKALDQMSETIVQTLNQKYGDNFIFAGADGHNVPFTIEDKKLYYRGVPVDAAEPNVLLSTDGSGAKVTMPDGSGSYILADTPSYSQEEYDDIKAADPAGSVLGTDFLGYTATDEAGNTVTRYVRVADAQTITPEKYDKACEDAEKLKYLSKEEKLLVDIGLGFQEKDGKLIESSAFDAALQGIDFIGFGLDEDGDPKNVYSIVQRLKEISDGVPDAGKWDTPTWDEFDRLVGKLERASSEFKTAFTNFDASTTKLGNNVELLEDNFYNLQEQYAELEDVDMADSITAFVWAQYCYNAALKVGNSVLSESLMDYLS